MGITERKHRDKERRIEEILTAAKGLFLDKGYLHTTMLDIAERSELSRRTIYLYFKSKDEITFAVMVEAFALLRDRLKKAVAKEGSAVEHLKQLRDAYLDFYHNDFEQFYFTLFFDLKLNMKNMSNEDAQEGFRMITDIMDIITSVIRQGIEENCFRPMESPERTAFTAGTMILSTMQKASVRRQLVQVATGFHEDELIMEMFDMIFNSILLNN